MKFGIRKPSVKKSIKARTTGKVKRAVKRAVNPTYGKKGMGYVNDPKKAVYNKVYNKTTVGVRDISKFSNGDEYVYYTDEELQEMREELIRESRRKRDKKIIQNRYSARLYRGTGIFMIIIACLLAIVGLLTLPIGLLFVGVGVLFFFAGKAFLRYAKLKDDDKKLEKEIREEMAKEGLDITAEKVE